MLSTVVNFDSDPECPKSVMTSVSSLVLPAAFIRDYLRQLSIRRTIPLSSHADCTGILGELLGVAAWEPFVGSVVPDAIGLCKRATMCQYRTLRR